MKKKNFLEIARQRGKCPDRYYNVLSGKPAGEILMDNRQKTKEQYQQRKEEAEKDAEMRKQIDQEVRKQADIAVEKLLKQIMR